MAITERSPASFDKLPFEIRLMIWKSTLPGPRLIHPGRHQTNAPIALSICAESRALALKDYRHAPVQGRITREDDPSDRPLVYFDPKIDYVFMSGHVYMEYVRCPMRIFRFVQVMPDNVFLRGQFVGVLPWDMLSPLLQSGFWTREQPNQNIHFVYLIREDGVVIPGRDKILGRRPFLKEEDNKKIDIAGAVRKIIAEAESFLDSFQEGRVNPERLEWNRPTFEVVILGANAIDWCPEQFRDESTEQARKNKWMKRDANVEDYAAYVIEASKVLERL